MDSRIIPTNLNDIFGNNFLAKHIYIELLLRTKDYDRVEEFNGVRHNLKKGCCIFSYKGLAREFGVTKYCITKLFNSGIEKIELLL